MSKNKYNITNIIAADEKTSAGYASKTYIFAVTEEGVKYLVKASINLLKRFGNVEHVAKHLKLIQGNHAPYFILTKDPRNLQDPAFLNPQAIEYSDSILLAELQDYFNFDKTKYSYSTPFDPSIQWYSFTQSATFLKSFFSYRDENLRSESVLFLNKKGEPKLQSTLNNNKVYKYFKNPKGDKLYLDTHNFSGLDPQDVKDLTDHLIFQALHGGYNFDSTKEIIDNLENILDDFVNTQIAELKNFHEKAIINKGEFKWFLLKMKKGINIYNTYLSEFKEEIKNRIEDFSIAKKQIVEEETDAAGIGEVVKKESFLRNSKDSASANIRIFLTYSLPRMSRNPDGTYTKEKGNYFNATSYQSFGQAWNILEPLLSNTFNEYEVNNEGETEFVDRFEQFENKIKSRIHIAPSLKTLLARFRNLSIEQKREFIKAFNKAKVNFVSNELEKTYKDNKVSKVTVKTIEEANSTGPEHSIYIEWQRVLENRYVKDGKYDTKNTIPNHKIVLDTLEDSVKALKKYGFNISKEAIEAARIEIDAESYKNVLRKFLTGLGHIHGKSVKDKYDNIPNVLTTEKKWYKSLAIMESFTRNIFGENTTRGPKGLYWNYSLPSYIDVLTDALANGDKEALNNIKSEYNRNSLLLEDIQDGKITIGTFLQGREKGKNGKDTSELTEQEDFVFQINRVLRGVLKNQKPIYNMLAAADKNRTLLLKGFRFYKTNKSPKYYDIFFNYLQDELNQYHANVENDIYYEPDLFLFAEFKDKLTEDGKLVTVLNNDHKKLVKEAVDEAVQLQIDDIKKDLGFTDVERYGIKSFSDRDKQLIDSSILYEYMNIDQALKDYVINSTIANVEMTKVYTGYPGWYKKAKEGASNKFADFFKRVPSTQTDGVYLALTKGDPKHFKLAITNKIEQKSKVLTSEKHIDNVFKMTSKYDKDLTKEQTSSVLKDYIKNNIGDAEGWATPERALFILERTSKTNEDSIKLMRRVVNGERLSIPELKSLTSSFQAIKGVHYQQVNGKPVYIKYSLMPLIPQFVEGSVMNDVLQKMRKDGIDELTNIDGVKVGVGTPNTITEDGKTISNLEFTNTIELENRFYKVQQELPTKDIKENNLASQIQRNILANLSKILNSEFADEPILNGRTPREVFNSIIESQIKLLDETKNKIDKELAHVDSDKINTEVLRDKILKELKRDSPDNIIQAVEKDISLDSLPNVKERIQAVISSYFKVPIAPIDISDLLETNEILLSILKPHINKLQNIIDQINAETCSSPFSAGRIVSQLSHIQLRNKSLANHIQKYITFCQLSTTLDIQVVMPVQPTSKINYNELIKDLNAFQHILLNTEFTITISPKFLSYCLILIFYGVPLDALLKSAFSKKYIKAHPNAFRNKGIFSDVSRDAFDDYGLLENYYLDNLNVESINVDYLLEAEMALLQFHKFIHNSTVAHGNANYHLIYNAFLLECLYKNKYLNNIPNLFKNNKYIKEKFKLECFKPLNTFFKGSMEVSNIDLIHAMASHISPKYCPKMELVNRICRFLSNHISAQVIQQIFTDSIQEISDENFIEELNILRNKYPENIFLQQLFVKRFNNQILLQITRTRRFTNQEINILSNGWHDLFLLETKFAYELVRRCFANSFFNTTLNGIADLVPNNFFTANLSKFDRFFGELLKIRSSLNLLVEFGANFPESLEKVESFETARDYNRGVYIQDSKPDIVICQNKLFIALTKDQSYKQYVPVHYLKSSSPKNRYKLFLDPFLFKRKNYYFAENIDYGFKRGAFLENLSKITAESQDD